MAEYRVVNPRIFKTQETYKHENPMHVHSDVLSLLFRSRNRYLVEKRNLSLRKFYDEGIGFYVTRTEITVHQKKFPDQEIVDIESYIDKYYLIGESSRIQVVYRMKLEDTVIFEGNIDFAIMDIKKGKAVACPPEYWQHFSLDSDQGKETAFEELTKVAVQKPSPVNPDTAKKHLRAVSDSEIDLYQHVNTTYYIKYIFDLLNENHKYNYSNMYFKKSLLKNDKFVVLSEEKQGQLLFEIRSEDLTKLYNVGYLGTRI